MEPVELPQVVVGLDERDAAIDLGHGRLLLWLDHAAPAVRPMPRLGSGCPRVSRRPAPPGSSSASGGSRRSPSACGRVDRPGCRAVADADLFQAQDGLVSQLVADGPVPRGRARMRPHQVEQPVVNSRGRRPVGTHQVARIARGDVQVGAVSVAVGRRTPCRLLDVAQDGDKTRAASPNGADKPGGAIRSGRVVQRASRKQRLTGPRRRHDRSAIPCRAPRRGPPPGGVEGSAGAMRSGQLVSSASPPLRAES